MAVPTRARVRGAIRRALDPDELTIKKTEDGWWVSLAKGDASAKLEFHDGWVNWTDIKSPGGLGWLAAAHDMVRAEFPALGVGYLEASGGAGPSCSEEGLKAHGAWVDTSGGRLRWDLG